MHYVSQYLFKLNGVYFQGHEYEEFVKAATSHNEIQFVEVNDIEVAKVLFPNIKPNNLFLGLVKSEMERYTMYGKLVICYWHTAFFFFFF